MNWLVWLTTNLIGSSLCALAVFAIRRSRVHPAELAFAALTYTLLWWGVVLTVGTH